MSSYRPLDRVRIPAAQRNHHRNLLLLNHFEDHSVAPLDAAQGQSQAAQPVAVQNVDTRLVKDHIRPEFGDLRQDRAERYQIFVVPDAVPQLDVDAAALLAEWKVVAGVE